ncbi:hypothetical protein CUMW_174910 [Citrus unshiu]|uniref:TPM domain-containing protein n=1 Tax=Citrus unshiu TaxID=55188 RepID=A0A2H5PWV1_CITUN|nr:hypothetical protein CUMW_174910 [Citrus unshiu]
MAFAQQLARSSLPLTTTIPSVFTSPIRFRASSLPISANNKTTKFRNWVTNFNSKPLSFFLSGALSLGVGCSEAKVGVNKPELLPREFTSVIDVAGREDLPQEIADLEKDTGFKLRVLARIILKHQDWQLKTFGKILCLLLTLPSGNILNFNVGASVDLDIPRSFWSRLAGKYGNIFYWKEKGEDASIEAAVVAISNCLREPVGPNNCSEVK